MSRNYGSSHRRCSIKKGVLRNFAKFTGKHLCQSLFLIFLWKKRLWHRCFPVNFAKFLRKAFFTEHFRWLLLILPWCLWKKIGKGSEHQEKYFIFFSKSTRAPRQSWIKWKIYPTMLDYLRGILCRNGFYYVPWLIGASWIVL